MGAGRTQRKEEINQKEKTEPCRRTRAGERGKLERERTTASSTLTIEGLSTGYGWYQGNCEGTFAREQGRERERECINEGAENRRNQSTGYGN